MAYQTTCRKCNNIWTSDVKAKECPKCNCAATSLLGSVFRDDIINTSSKLNVTGDITGPTSDAEKVEPTVNVTDESSGVSVGDKSPES